MSDETRRTRDEGRDTKEEGYLTKASIVSVSGANVRPSFLAVVLCFLLLSSCGYRFSPSGGLVPEGAKNIAILTFVNNTNEPYVDVEVTKAVADEFVADGRLKVVDLEAADMVLKGTVAAFTMIPQSYTVDSYVQQYMVSLVVNVSLEDVKAHKILLQERGLSSIFVSSFPVTYTGKNVEITVTKLARDGAIKKASRDIALTLRSRVLEGF